MALGLKDFVNYVDYDKQSLYISAASIAFNPLFWNIVARQEYHNKLLTKIFGGNSQVACYALAATIFSLGMIRDFIFKTAIAEQPTHPALVTDFIQAAAVALFIVGNVLVVSSTWRLGITGTFLGDYFGILMDEMVTGFPFNVTGSPMYTGSTCSFLATAMWYGKPAGVLLTLWVDVVYRIALKFEDPFTSEIYAKRERERVAGKKSN
ncbi:probable OPI3-methylene-fatty-acyl-phospholipid synthase [Fusarium mangiferae]|uniref:Phosphatidyl-N-methylethanolamine N-methyltransferase n=1 Tax=Fusarium mangiferae TaxID=192010 RepID=A0A1L7T4A8_FUSMA|nr:putative OPI3-methylene-fatty-acyl-phospholipid synthase [Fusarium mangiferae]CVK90963.1 probable OPI3-methylene-fatty-acyl-phospholipid synthase [Fusarium mangiferae]